MSKVIIADDDANFRETMEEVLQSGGYEPLAFPSGDKALSAYETMMSEGKEPVACIIDVLLPKVAGFDLVKKLTALGANAPIIMVSGIMKNSEDEALELGCKAFLPKPFDNDDLIAKLDALVGPGGAAAVAEPEVEQRPLPPEGTLLENPVFHLLWRAEREGHSGVLEIFSNEGRGRVFVYRGSGLMAQHWKSQLNVGFQLVKGGHLTPEMYQQAIEEACNESRGIYDVIKHQGWVREAAFKTAYKALVPLIIAELAAVSGNFRWIATEEFAKLIPAGTTKLWDPLLVGVRKATSQQLTPHIEPRNPLRLAPGDNWERIAPQLEKACGSDSLARAINGRATISQLVAASRNDSERAMRMRQIFLLMNTQAVQASLEVIKYTAPEMPAERPAPAAEAAPETDAPAAKASAPGAIDPSLDEGIDFNAEEIDSRERIKLKWEMSHGKSHWEVLGVAPGADEAECKKAYFTLAREYHTDAFAGQRLGSMGPVLDELFSLISQAYSTLTDPDKRADFLAGEQMKESGQSTDIGELMAAERDFAKGRTLLERGEMVSASKFFDKAVQVNPGNGEWKAHALFSAWWVKRNPQTGPGLITELEAIYKANENLMDALYFAGRLALEIGDLRKAKGYMRKVLEEDRNHAMANRDMRLVQRKAEEAQAAEKKSGGLMGRLKRR